MDTSPTEPIVEMNQAYYDLLQAQLPAPENAKQYPHYFKKLPAAITHVDVYRVEQLFEVPGGPIAHALKKLLCTGKRGTKDRRQDLIEARASISRALEMMDEDEADEVL